MTQTFSATRYPLNYNWELGLYIVEGSAFSKGVSPRIRRKTPIKVAFTKSFRYFESWQTRKANNLWGQRGRTNNWTDAEYVAKAFDITRIFRANGPLIFDRESPLMEAYANGLVTKEDVIDSIDW